MPLDAFATNRTGDTVMKKIFEIVKNIVREDEGASMVEYAVGVGFIAAAVIAGVTLFGGKLTSAFTSIGNTVDAASTGTTVQ